MRLDTPWARRSGDYKVTVDRLQYGSPEAVIRLDEEGGLELARVTLDDCDRLIKAAAIAKQQVLAVRAEMAAVHGTQYVYSGRCQLCGEPEGHDLHAEPAKAESDETAASVTA
jgi:hypothetical protein